MSNLPQRAVLLAPALLLTALAPAQAPAPRNVSGGVLTPEQACYDVKHYDLVLAVDPASETIDGKLTMTAKWVAASPQPALALDLDPALEACEVTMNREPVKNRRDGGRIVIEPAFALAPGSQFTVEVAYRGTPHEARRPPWDGGFTWKKTKDGEPWIATSCQGEGADLWWPCKDHPSDKPDGVDLHITVPEGLVVASNGTRVGKPEVSGKLATFHWHVASPISNYCIALNIAPYVELDDTFTCIDGTVMPFQFFVLPESVEKAKRFKDQFLDHLKVFEEILGPYPFRAEKYGIAETPHLGMEHQTIIAYGNGFKDEKYDWLHNHELSHEWWGNLVTCRDWKDMWIHEGFGTYMQPLYRERRFGRAAYQEEMKKARTMNMAPVAPRETKDSHEIYSGASGGDIYYKGSWVLHTLRWQMGDEKFFQALREFCYPTEAARKATDGSQVRLVDTDDFVALCSKIAGEDLAWFFEVYVRQPHLPKLRSEKRDGVLELRWETPQDLPFSLPVPVLLGERPFRVEMKGGQGALEVGDAEYEIDPELRMLMVRPRAAGR